MASIVYDAIVVGAGPSGSTAARELAQQGASVLLLDRARFPRDKPCGGGVTPRAARLLPFGLAPVTERTVHGVRFSLRMAGAFTRYTRDPVTYLTQRRYLDAYLVQKAVEAGAVFQDGDSVSRIEQAETRVAVVSRSGHHQARLLIGADGANGVTARLTGLTGERDVAVALEGNIPADNDLINLWRDAIGMDLGGIPGGYGWLFPKGDHLNVGVGGWQYLAPSFRERLHRLIRHYGLPGGHLYALRGHHLPVRRAGAPIARGRIALVGDAAGLIDPLSGEGIYAAVYSGRAAARAGARLLDGEEAALTAYVQRVERDFMPDLRASRRFQDVFYLLPGVYVALLKRSDLIWEQLACLIRGDQSYVGFKRRLGPLGWAVDAASFAVRRTSLGRVAGLPSWHTR